MNVMTNMRKLSLLLLLAAGCSQETKPATAIAISVKTDLPAAELASVEYRVFPVNGNPQVDQPVAKVGSSAAQLTQPFVVEKNKESEILIAVQGFGPGGEPVVEFRTRARFETEETVLIPIYLAKSCVKKACMDPAQTCHGDARYQPTSGACGPVPFPSDPTTLVESGQEDDWQPVVAQVPPPPPCTSAPGRTPCDPVANCGCPTGQGCQLTNEGAAHCAPLVAQPAAKGGTCQADSSCGGGLGCALSGTCAALCASDADCGGGACIKGDRTYGWCLPKCGAGAPACPATLACSPLRKVRDADDGTYCINPSRECRADNICDEPGIGSGLCAPDTDSADCDVCDPVRQTACPGDSTCLAISQMDGTWTPQCRPAGSVQRGKACPNGHSDCDEMFACLGGTCQPYCTPGSTDQCGAGEQCLGLASASNVTLDPPLGGCAKICTSQAQCGAGVSCSATATSPRGFCYVP